MSMHTHCMYTLAKQYRTKALSYPASTSFCIRHQRQLIQTLCCNLCFPLHAAANLPPTATDLLTMGKLYLHCKLCLELLYNIWQINSMDKHNLQHWA